eukprot:scaffold10.g2365.t1
MKSGNARNENALSASHPRTWAARWRSLVVNHIATRTELRVQQPAETWTAAAAPRSHGRPGTTRRLSVRADAQRPGNGALPAAGTAAAGWLLRDPPTSSPPFDAIMVLGGGLLPDGGLPEWVCRRLEGGLALFQRQQEKEWEQHQHQPQQQQQQQNGKGPVADAATAAATSPAAAAGPALVLLGAGTPHKRPVLDSGGHVLHEATAYASFLVQRGVPPGALLKEVQSYDTVGNGYFSALIHAVPAGWRRAPGRGAAACPEGGGKGEGSGGQGRCLGGPTVQRMRIAVVTSDFHMPRTRAVFDTCYALAGASLRFDPAWFDLQYFPVSDEDLFGQEVLAARAAKEAMAVVAWAANTAHMRGLPDLHAWLFATHLCYSVSRQHEFGRVDDLDPRLAATY